MIVLDDDTSDDESPRESSNESVNIETPTSEASQAISLSDDEREALETELRIQRLRRRREILERELRAIDQELSDIDVSYRSVVNSDQFEQYQQSITNGTVDQYLASVIGMRRRRTMPRTFCDVDQHRRNL